MLGASGNFAPAGISENFISAVVTRRAVAPYRLSGEWLVEGSEAGLRFAVMQADIAIAVTIRLGPSHDLPFVIPPAC